VPLIPAFTGACSLVAPGSSGSRKGVDCDYDAVLFKNTDQHLQRVAVLPQLFQLRYTPVRSPHHVGLGFRGGTFPLSSRRVRKTSNCSAVSVCGLRRRFPSAFLPSLPTTSRKQNITLLTADMYYHKVGTVKRHGKVGAVATKPCGVSRLHHHFSNPPSLLGEMVAHLAQGCAPRPHGKDKAQCHDQKSARRHIGNPHSCHE